MIDIIAKYILKLNIINKFKNIFNKINDILSFFKIFNKKRYMKINKKTRLFIKNYPNTYYRMRNKFFEEEKMKCWHSSYNLTFFESIISIFSKYDGLAMKTERDIKMKKREEYCRKRENYYWSKSYYSKGDIKWKLDEDL